MSLFILDGDYGSRGSFIGSRFMAAPNYNISGFNGPAVVANGEYAVNGNECNCSPVFKKITDPFDIETSNSFSFLNFDNFYTFSTSSSINFKTGYTEQSPNPLDVSVNSNSAQFSSGSHFLKLNFNTFTDFYPSDIYHQYFAILFDDPINDSPNRILNYNLLNSQIEISFKYIYDTNFNTDDNKGFQYGLIIKQNNTYYINEFGYTGESSSETHVSQSKSYIDYQFLRFSGFGPSKPDLSGEIGFEYGIFFYDHNAGGRTGLFQDFSVSFNNVIEKTYFLFNHSYYNNDFWVLSDKECDISNGSSFILSSTPDPLFNFDPTIGSSPSFTGQSAKGEPANISEVINSIPFNHSDNDEVFDDFDLYPFGRNENSLSILHASQISAIGPNSPVGSFSDYLEINLEGKIYRSTVPINDINEDNQYNYVDFMEDIANQINLDLIERGVYAYYDSRLFCLLFWRPKGGQPVSYSVKVSLNDSVIDRTPSTPTPGVDYVGLPNKEISPSYLSIVTENSYSRIAVVEDDIIFSSNGMPNPAIAGLNSSAYNPTFNTGSITAQNYYFSFSYNGGKNVSNPQNLYDQPIGITLNGCPIYSFNSNQLENGFSYPQVGYNYPPAGFSFNMVHLKNLLDYDLYGGYLKDGQYRYQSGDFYLKGLKSSFINSNSYFYSLAYNPLNTSISDNLRHIDGHSKILGFCLDGYPIYGPYGYVNNSDPYLGVKNMRSSYSLRPVESEGRLKPYSTYAAGTYNQDYQYISNSGDLDDHNGRYCVTPDFPFGTYAYFLTFNDENIPEFPYIIGPSSKNSISVTNLNINDNIFNAYPSYGFSTPLPPQLDS